MGVVDDIVSGRPPTDEDNAGGERGATVTSTGGR